VPGGGSGVPLVAPYIADMGWARVDSCGKRLDEVSP